MEMVFELFIIFTGRMLKDFFRHGFRMSLRDLRRKDRDDDMFCAVLGVGFWILLFVAIRWGILPALGYVSKENP